MKGYIARVNIDMKEFVEVLYPYRLGLINAKDCSEKNRK